MQRNRPPTPAQRRALAVALVEHYAAIVDAPEALLDSLLKPLPATLWADPRRISRDALQTILAGDGLRSRPIAWHPHALRLPAGSRPGLHWTFLAGLSRIQEEVSMLPVVLLDPQPGERVLDLCAAPGNKTAQIAIAMQDTGTVVANDSKRGRIAALRQMIKRLGLTSCSVTVRDGQGMDRRAGTFDRVLVDAPCSCEGTFRKVRVPEPVDDELRLRSAAVQLRLLHRAVALTRPGGRIVYSTCTFAPEENEAVVDAILRQHPEVLQLRHVEVPGLRTAPGIAAWQGQSFLPEIQHCLRVWPHQQDTGGFFVAVFDRLDGAGMPADETAFLPAAETNDWLAPLTERFGIPSAAFADVRLIRRGNRHVHALSAGHQAPRAPAPEMLGLPLIRRKSLPLKPTTSAVLRWGRHATRNRLDLSAAQRDAFLRRDDCLVSPDQRLDCTGPGYVIVRFAGYTIGLGQLIFDRDSPTVRLISLVPKAWARDTGAQDPGSGG
ncbi:RsmB/NOP family class I SAM-dependent RNA methyltransferase [Methylonatrum kenyense]|uniref:RsmB/NOP family class I SAM-dependent RNA methyltransferase n=1 Tax=Methylonatrum kenyense TaxID=455253 RepID=UPI0020BDEBF0|nr:RsmB/NOP family class I SAM-dependent RNA methyltransferase [Methylonatrum kenyense]MCK8516452.1 RsmB/NOP family class I SAM-dependent RNA methyltransferase [Methylonatrum kenyense]